MLAIAARHGRLLLVAGLVAGLTLPGVAAAVRPWLAWLVAALMFVAALRIGPGAAAGALRDLSRVAGVALAYQLALPVVLALAFAAAGVGAAPLAVALVLMAAASPISGSPNLTIMAGGDPAPSLRLLVVGTALLPLTVLPVLWLTPALGEAGAVLAAAARLFGVIAVATGAAYAVRAALLPQPSARAIARLDGLGALLMAVVVVGLMTGAQAALAATPVALAGWLAAAFAANFGLQVAAGLALSGPARTAFAIAAGNRNIALFLIALPAEVTDPLLLFIGCYQVPMYLTPILLGRFYRPA